jgi:hypothetical protein
MPGERWWDVPLKGDPSESTRGAKLCQKSHVYQRFLRRNSKFYVFYVLCWETYLLLSLFKWIITGSTSRKRAPDISRRLQPTWSPTNQLHRCSELSRAILYFSSPIWSNPIGKEKGNGGFPFRRGQTFFWLIPHCDTQMLIQ